MVEDEMVRQHHRLNGHEFEQTLGDNEDQGSLACFSPWGRQESYMTQQMNNKQLVTEKFEFSSFCCLKKRYNLVHLEYCHLRGSQLEILILEPQLCH